MPVRVLPDFLINQIAAGEVVERPASVVKELVENALDAGADQIVIDVVDGGRTEIRVIDNGAGMTVDDLKKAITRHATSKLPDDDLLNITYMGFRGEALPSIASVSDMTIDTFNAAHPHGWRIDCTTGNVMPSDWDSGTRVRVCNLFGKTPARLKFLRGDRAEMLSVVDVVKRLALARPDVGFVLNNKWRFGRDMNLADRIVAVMGDDVRDRMIEIDATSQSTREMKLYGFVSMPTLRRASGADQYLFVNGRPVRDKVLIGALRAAYVDVMHAREFPLCALYLTLDPRCVDVNVSPAKTDVHFLEPSHVRAFIIKAVRDAIARPLADAAQHIAHTSTPPRFIQTEFIAPARAASAASTPVFTRPVLTPQPAVAPTQSRMSDTAPHNPMAASSAADLAADQNASAGAFDRPLGRVVGQIGDKYIIAECASGLVIVDQHAAHERITYEKLRNKKIPVQPLITPIVVNMRAEDAIAVCGAAAQLRECGLAIDEFGDGAVAIFERPADWDLNWADVLHSVADEIRANGHSSNLAQRLHLKLANFACHHSVRAGQKLDRAQMDALLRDIEETSRAGQCNHGRPVYKIIPWAQVDAWFER